MQCGACNRQLRPKGDTSKDSTVGCTGCNQKYHASCLDLGREDLRQIRTTGSIQSCPSCQTRKRNQNSDTTPVRVNPTGPSDRDVKSGAHTGNASSSITPSTNPSSFERILKDMEGAFSKMKVKMEDFTASLNSTTDDIFEFRKELNDLKKQVRELDAYKKEVNSLRLEVTELRQELATHQQRQYLRDIEITGLTEHQQENLVHTVSVLSAKLGVDLDPRDIDDVRRVGSRDGPVAHEALRRPRPVIVTLVRRSPRDQLLRAARVRRDITTDKIEVPGNPRKIFINEHLTKNNRVLFSKARSTGKELKFKYIWTSNGNVFMRRSDTSSVMRVTSEAMLDRLVGDSKDLAAANGKQCS